MEDSSCELINNLYLVVCNYVVSVFVIEVFCDHCLCHIMDVLEVLVIIQRSMDDTKALEKLLHVHHTFLGEGNALGFLIKHVVALWLKLGTFLESCKGRCNRILSGLSDDYAPFKAIFNEHYSKDIAKKVHTAYLSQARKGRFTGCVAPFGYKKDPEDNTHLIIDEETAPYVRDIFDMATDGHGVGYIKRRLEQNKVPCPTWWNRERGIRNHYTKYELDDPENGKYVWDDTVLTDMLINPVYYGAVSSQKKRYKFKLGVLGEKAPEDWIVVENMHEPIVDQDTFDVVQEKIKSRKCSRGDGSTSLFAGLIKCGECGKALTIRKTNAKNPIDIYSCKTYNHHGKNHCTQHRVEYDTLYDIVLNEIRDIAQKTLDADEVAEDIQKSCEADRLAERESIQRQLLKSRDRLDMLERLVSKLYDDLLSEKITEKNFDTMMARTTKEQNELATKIEEYQ